MEYLEPIPSDYGEGEEDSEEDSESEDEEYDEEDTEVEDHPRTSPRRHLLNGNAVNFVASEELGREIGNNISNVAAAESECEVISTDASKAGVNDRASNNPEEGNTSEIDGLYCPICFDAWSSGGDHHVCCLPCGHIYGLSCIKKWLLRRGSSKCPQCKQRCVMKDIRLLYASRIVTVDGNLQKKIQSLEAKCMSLEKKNADLSKKEVQSKKRESDLHKQVCYLKYRTCDLEALVEDMEHRVSGPTASSCNYHGEFASGHDLLKIHGADHQRVVPAFEADEQEEDEQQYEAGGTLPHTEPEIPQATPPAYLAAFMGEMRISMMTMQNWIDAQQQQYEAGDTLSHTDPEIPQATPPAYLAAFMGEIRISMMTMQNWIDAQQRYLEEQRAELRAFREETRVEWHDQRNIFSGFEQQHRAFREETRAKWREQDNRFSELEQQFLHLRGFQHPPPQGD